MRGFGILYYEEINITHTPLIATLQWNKKQFANLLNKKSEQTQLQAFYSIYHLNMKVEVRNTIHQYDTEGKFLKTKTKTFSFS